MSKFKVIEKSRFLDDEGMENIKGGAPDTIVICTINRAYHNCPSLTNYTTCQVPSAAGYSICTGTIVAKNTCSWGFKYETMCGLDLTHQTHCGPNQAYVS